MSQAAWETAMGMRGYSGSPAEREDRKNKAYTCGTTGCVNRVSTSSRYCYECNNGVRNMPDKRFTKR